MVINWPGSSPSSVSPPSPSRVSRNTWTLALDRIRAHNPVAQDLLSLCAFLAPEDLPRALLTEHPDVLPERLATTVNDPLAYQQTIAALRRYSLVTMTGDALRTHRLVQAVTRHALAPVEQQQWATCAVRLLLASFPEGADDANARPTPSALTTERRHHTPPRQNILSTDMLPHPDGSLLNDHNIGG